MTNLRNIDNISVKIPLNTFLNMLARVNKYLKQGGNIADTREIPLTYPKGVDSVSYSKFKEMLQRYNTFVTTHGRQPSYIITVKTSTVTTNKDCYHSPRWYSGTEMKQNTNYFCGCNLPQQVLYELTGNYYSEYYLAKLEGTKPRKGTGPEAITITLKNLLKKAGYTVKRCEWIAKSSIDWNTIGQMIENPKQAIGIHSLYRDTWGHYEYPCALCNSTKIITIANSLSGGYIEKREFSVQQRYIDEMSGNSILVVEIE